MNERRRQGADRQLVRARHGGGRAGHRPGQGDGGQPRYTLDQSEQRPAHRPGKRGARSRATTRTRSNPLLGGGDMPGYQAGSTFKIFTMLAALDAGMPLNTAINSPHALRVEYLDRAGEPGACGGHWCPHNASERDDRRADHVDRLRQVGEHVLRPAGAEGRRRQGGPRWPSGSGLTLAHRRRPAAWPRPSKRRRLGRVHPRRRRHHPAGDGQRVRHPRRRRHVLRAAAGALDHRARTASRPCTSGGARVAEPRCHQAVTPDVARAATDAARCVTGYGAAKGSCGGWSTAPGVYGTVGPPGRPARPAPPTTPGRPGSSGSRPELAAASFIADPDNPFNVVGDGKSQIPMNAVARDPARRAEGHSRPASSPHRRTSIVG